MKTIVGPWDEIAISYVLVVNAVARNRPADAFKEQSQLVSCAPSHLSHFSQKLF